MSVRLRLRILMAVTLAGLILISIFTIYGLKAIQEAGDTVHRRRVNVVGITEIKASAMSTIMLDPLLPETKAIFADAEKNIGEYGERAKTTIRRAEVRDKLAKTLALWSDYDSESQKLIKLAATDVKAANEKLTPLYNQKFKPFQASLESFIVDMTKDAQQAKAEATKLSNETFWEVISLILLVAGVTADLTGSATSRR